VLPVNGTREGLFAFAQAVVDAGRDALVLMPNPFYQIYEGAALLAGAEPQLPALHGRERLHPGLGRRRRRDLARAASCSICARRATPPAPSPTRRPGAG
jgi:aspartate/methionine/tyrosine aminotransferase